MIFKRFIIYFTSVGLLIIIAATYSFTHSFIIKNYFTEIKKTTEEINTENKLEKTAQLIRYDDEVLTQSARNYAYTGDSIWKKRYEEYAPILDKRIAEAKELGDEAEVEFFNEIDQANQKLIELEENSFLLVENDKLNEAQAILDSKEYQDQKNIYKNALEKYLNKRNLDANMVKDLSTEKIDRIIVQSNYYGIIEDILLSVLIISSILMLISSFLLILNRMFKPLFEFKKAVKEITNGKYGINVEIKTQDEVADFAKDFNKMSRDLKEARENIEAKVKDRTEELEKLNRFMTGRELKMIELKKKIQDLEQINENKK